MSNTIELPLEILIDDILPNLQPLELIRFLRSNKQLLSFAQLFNDKIQQYRRDIERRQKIRNLGIWSTKEFHLRTSGIVKEHIYLNYTTTMGKKVRNSCIAYNIKDLILILSYLRYIPPTGLIHSYSTSLTNQFYHISILDRIQNSVPVDYINDEYKMYVHSWYNAKLDKIQLCDILHTVLTDN